MGTTQTTDQTGKFAPGQLQNLQNLQNISVPLISGWMQNPTNNPWFQLQQQLGTRQAQNLGGTQTSNILRNLNASGLGGSSSSPFQMEMLQNQNRANTGLQSQLGFLNPMQNAQQLQLFGAGQAQGYRPFQTGQTQTQSTGGLGTWLPQVAETGLSAAMAPFTGGASLLGPMMSQGMHMGQGSNPGGWSGMGSNSPFQPSTFDPGSSLTPPPSMGGSSGGGVPSWMLGGQTGGGGGWGNGP